MAKKNSRITERMVKWPTGARSEYNVLAGMDRARQALESYVHDLEPDYRYAILNFLVDFLHLTKENAGVSPERLKELIDEAAGLQRVEEQSVAAENFELIFEREEPRRRGKKKVATGEPS